jgi:hypothetical protein
MTLKIDANRTISEIREEFTGLFPYLKLEFFKTSHEAAEASRKREMIKTDEKMSKISRNQKFGSLKLSPVLTVASLEAAMRDQFGLNVQVFRKSGNVWLETTITDNLTLQTQNALGKEKSFAAEQPDITDFDYD